MAKVFQKENILDFIDSYKYDPGQLFRDLRVYPIVGKQVKKLLGPLSEKSDWPLEFRNWRAALFGLMANEVGGIANPMLREKAAERLLKTAAKFGISSSKVSMICGGIYPFRIKLQRGWLNIPQELESSGVRGDKDGRQ